MQFWPCPQLVQRFPKVFCRAQVPQEEWLCEGVSLETLPSPSSSPLETPSPQQHIKGTEKSCS